MLSGNRIMNFSNHPVDLASFVHQLETIHQRSQELERTSREVPQEQMQLVLGHVETLQTALEELYVAEEELRQQNEKLISARHNIEQERQRYQELFEFAPDGYVVTDIHGVVWEANRVAANLLNVAQSRLIGKPLSSFVPEAERRSFRSMLNQLPTLNRVQEWEIYLQGRGTSAFQAALTIDTVRDGSGNPVVLRWLLRDISLRKQAETQLSQLQLENFRLMEADRLKNEFFRTLSHELRTPINAIVGFANLLIHQLHRHGDDPKFVHMLQRIVVNSRHLLTLIEEILDFSKLHANRLQLHPQPFDLAEMATESVDQMRSLAEQKQLDLSVHLSHPVLLVCNDPTRVRQVIINLLSNAIKFTHTGRVWLEVEELGDDRVALTVSDTGIGIAPEDQERIFQEFWQVNLSLTREYGGTGLGLAITRALVQLMQGKIRLQSRIDEGSVFRVELPRWLLPESAPGIEPIDPTI